MNIADLVDPRDPDGRTYRQINTTKVHRIQKGKLVELESGVRLFVVHLYRDCDQAPLYALSADPDDTALQNPAMWTRGWVTGYPESALRVVR